MSSTPLVTVLMPVHNSADFLRAAIDSVLAQTFKDFELLIIDDGSTDSSAGIIRSYNDPRVRHITNERNLGLVASLNKGIEAALGTYIARMDGDDIMRPERLARQVETMRTDPGISVLATTVDLINTDGEVYGAWDTDRAALSGTDLRAMMPRTNCIAHPSVMIRRDALGGLRYDARQHGAEDWDMWLRLMARGHRIAKLEEPLLAYRVHPASITAQAKQRIPLERRLMRTRARFLLEEWSHGRACTFHLMVLKAQMRTLARHWRDHIIPSIARGVYRLLSYSPIRLLREQRMLSRALAEWQGHHAFVFSYLNTGGAEQVHADIMVTVREQRPIIFITGSSKDRGFADRFAACGTVVEIPHLLHHPCTARSAQRRIVAALNAREQPVLFGANTDHFALWGAQLKPGARLIHLIHAFLHQPSGNRKHKAWLPLFARMDRYVFVADQARREFEGFLFGNGLPRTAFGKLTTIPNAVHGFGQVEEHAVPGILFVGRDSAEKRLDLFLRIADELHRTLPGKYRFTVMGARIRPGHPHVHFLGTITDAAARDNVYRANDVLVLTSDREGFPMVIMEGMAQGLAIVATPVGDIPERVEPGFGMISSSTARETVIQEMVAGLSALAQDPERMIRMRHAALEHARGAFGMERFRERYRDLLMSPAGPH